MRRMVLQRGGATVILAAAAVSTVAMAGNMIVTGAVVRVDSNLTAGITEYAEPSVFEESMCMPTSVAGATTMDGGGTLPPGTCFKCVLIHYDPVAVLQTPEDGPIGRVEFATGVYGVVSDSAGLDLWDEVCGELGTTSYPENEPDRGLEPGEDSVTIDGNAVDIEYGLDGDDVDTIRVLVECPAEECQLYEDLPPNFGPDKG